MVATAQGSTYALGHSPEELDRLDRQGEILRPITRRMLEAAGIGPGMRVLDVGCGTGDVSLLVRELVGEEGYVVGVDRAPEALAAARSRFAARGIGNAALVEADLEAFVPEGRFDAVVGRLVLMHLSDPAAVVRRLREAVRPGGKLCFVDIVLPTVPLFNAGRWPTADRAQGWVTAAFARAGCATDMGLRVAEVFRDAGLGFPEVRVEGLTIAERETAKLRWLAGTVRSLLPLMVKFGIATEDEVGIDTLGERLIAEAAARPGIVMPIAYGGAWATTPA